MSICCRLILQISIIVNMAAAQLSQSPEVNVMAVSNTHFTFDLLRKCTENAKDQNVFFAPYSITTALGMTYLGARGNTKHEMKKVLKWSEDIPKKDFCSYLSLLKEAANEKPSGYILAGAQSVYVDGRLTLKSKFSSDTQEHFASEAMTADFRRNHEAERQKINDGVLKQTRGKIRDLLPEGSIDSSTAMVLVQALYFKGNWMHKFDARNTHPADFRIAKEETIKVNMMEQTRNFKYGVSKVLECSAVELPYASNKGSTDSHDLSMLILLPNKQDGLEQLEADLTYDHLEKLQSSMHSVKVNLKLPRFTVESSFELKKVLEKLGIRQAFGDSADFSDMVEEGELAISEVYHKAVVEVNEEGSEAAAATAAVMMLRSMPIMKPFVADHPFLFFIIDKRAEVVLFTGRVVRPPTAGPAKQKEDL